MAAALRALADWPWLAGRVPCGRVTVWVVARRLWALSLVRWLGDTAADLPIVHVGWMCWGGGLCALNTRLPKAALPMFSVLYYSATAADWRWSGGVLPHTSTAVQLAPHSTGVTASLRLRQASVESLTTLLSVGVLCCRLLSIYTVYPPSCLRQRKL